MDIGERCVITMLPVRLAMWHADNLGIEKVSYDTNNNGHKKCEELCTVCCQCISTYHVFTSDPCRTDSQSEHVCCSTSASQYTHCNDSE